MPVPLEVLLSSAAPEYEEYLAHRNSLAFQVAGVLNFLIQIHLHSQCYIHISFQTSCFYIMSKFVVFQAYVSILLHKNIQAGGWYMF